MSILKSLLILSLAGLLPSGMKYAPREGAKENYYFTNYDTKAESLEAGEALNNQILEEGITLLKNEDNALPIASGSKVSIFGNFSTDLIYNGAGSGSGSSGKQIPLQEVFTNAGLEFNPALTDFYSNDSLSPKPGSLTGYTINAGYNLRETPVATLEQNVSTTTYDEYNDAAFIVISRSGMEAADLPKGMSTGFTGTGLNGNKVDGARYFDDHSLQPTQAEADLIHYVEQYFDKIVILLNTGSAFEAGFLDDPGHYAYSPNIKAALWFGFPGKGEGLNALGKIITGEINPSGHTVDTYARDFKNDPTWHNMPTYSNSLVKYTNSSKSLVNYKEGIYIGYRYYETRGFTEGDAPYDSKLENGQNSIHNTTTTSWDNWYESAVVYPLGYGLSYTTFNWELVGTSLEADSVLGQNDEVTLNVKVTNTGEKSGKDVVQLYYTAPYTANEIAKAHVNLADYAKTKTLAPGESQILSLSIKVQDMASYDYNDANTNGFKGYELDGGNYVLKLSQNAHEPVLTVDYSIPEEGYKYETSSTGKEINNLFSNAEMPNTVYLSRDDWEGTFPQKITESERVAPQSVLDEVNATSNSNQILANDDPSDPWYCETMPTTGNNTGSIQLTDLYGLDYDDPLWDSFLNQFAVGDKTTAGMAYTVWNAGWYIYGIDALGFKTTHQEDGPSGLDGRHEGGTYTNFASETVLASTYNKDLAYQKGLIIGNQGLFGNTMSVSGLYAPSVNLHRSQFGGRNFEYYSEDPYISGEMAGHIIKGCNEKGMITFLKHFAVNEQESNRENLLTWANEQSIRELYLKPFQICVEEYHTHGIMSALNNLGATWVGGNYNLLTVLLREEWGFEGMVITDYIQGRAQLNGNLAIRAGGDILLATSGSQQNPVGLDSPTTVASLRRAMHNICYTTVNYTAIYNNSIENILGQYQGSNLTPAIAGYDYKAEVNTCLTNDGSDSKRVVQYALKEGEKLPDGLTLSADGVISGVPAANYQNYTFTVVASYEHSKREAEFTLPVVDKDLSVIYTKPVDVSINTGYVGEAYHQDVNWATIASGESLEISYGLAEGSLLPEGLTLSKDGTISGTPTKTCFNYEVTIEASADGKLPMSVTLQLTIGNRIIPSEKVLKTGKVNQQYAESIANDQLGLTYRLDDNSSLPSGLRLTDSGTIVGTPTAAVSNHSFTVVISGDDYITTTKTYTISIAISYPPFSLDDMTVNSSVEVPVNFAIGGNNITYEISDGRLPDGLELTSDGILKGTPTRTGNYTFTIRAKLGEDIQDEVTVSLTVNPSQSNNNYIIGMSVGIGTIVLGAIAILIFFLYFDKRNRIDNSEDDDKDEDNKDDDSDNSEEKKVNPDDYYGLEENKEKKEKKKADKKKRKVNLKVMIPTLSGFLAFGTGIVLCIHFLTPSSLAGAGSQTFTFEAEYVYLDDFNGAGLSNSADGVDNIYGDGNEADIANGYSNGYFLGNTYAENQIDFNFESSMAASAKLTLRLASELGDLTLNNDVFGVELNGEAIDYSIVVSNSTTSGKYDFADYPINTTMNLAAGDNTVSLIIKNNKLLNGNRTGAPFIDCIKITTEAELSWEPLTDNPSRRGSI